MSGRRVTKEPPAAETLPRGRHNLSREHVRDSQRARLVQAMIDLVGEQGFAATTVPAVVARARVSRNAFYEHFADKTDCFIAVCDENVRGLHEGLLGFASAPTWFAALNDGMAYYLAHWNERPAISRAYFVELPAAGERALAQRDRTYAQFRTIFEGLAARARAEHTGLPPLAPVVPRIIVVAITELLGEEVRAGRVAQLGELHDELVRLTARLLTSDALADELRAARGGSRGRSAA